MKSYTRHVCLRTVERWSETAHADQKQRMLIVSIKTLIQKIHLNHFYCQMSRNMIMISHGISTNVCILEKETLLLTRFT